MTMKKILSFAAMFSFFMIYYRNNNSYHQQAFDIKKRHKKHHPEQTNWHERITKGHWYVIYIRYHNLEY